MDAHGTLDLPSEDSDLELGVTRDDDARVYAATVEGRRIATLQYDVAEGRIILLSTVVVPDFRGRGIAGGLIADALDDVRDRGLRVTVRCPVVAAFIAENGQYADLLAPG
ncbi:GNAT family N-acetyltransferase [Agromyces seonyuensis]|uniref:GNAT family N-acetyltransferase n=1 Tax=Agromyces seonyuensis TaxID=2662446 RepID=A0A6I4NZ74_9MICO|nr:GNAT family N-acetyltransferase [Agromyces seonyuensis]MWB98512.1 GNAT family N-acetyltransferase [Agromyces seonyuensis]